MKDKIKAFFKRNASMYILFKNIYVFKGKVLNYLFGSLFNLMPIEKRKIVICSYLGKGYGDNGKYIAEEIIKQELDCDIVWLLKKELNDKVEFPSQIRMVEYNSFKGLYELATAKVWIDNGRKFFYPPKRKGQFYIQTWHGSLGIKKIEKDVQDVLSKDYINAAKKDSKMTDLCISNGNHISNLYKNSFWYNGEVVEYGCPRNDILFSIDNRIKHKVLNYFNLPKDAKIVLYAPTFRKSEKTDVYNLSYIELIKTLVNRFGDNWIILIRLHPNISMMADDLVYGSTVINATNYDDMQELLATSDVIITDYSSCSFDFALTKRPCFLYVPDVKEYMNDRNFYFSLDEIPFSYSLSNEELFANIMRFNKDIYTQNIESFFVSQGIVEDGKASERVVEKIKELIKGY
jgi:CDP-glycerol glycerophosphotransferase